MLCIIMWIQTFWDFGSSFTSPSGRRIFEKMYPTFKINPNNVVSWNWTEFRARTKYSNWNAFVHRGNLVYEQCCRSMGRTAQEMEEEILKQQQQQFGWWNGAPGPENQTYRYWFCRDKKTHRSAHTSYEGVRLSNIMHLIRNKHAANPGSKMNGPLSPHPKSNYSPWPLGPQSLARYLSFNWSQIMQNIRVLI